MKRANCQLDAVPVCIRLEYEVGKGVYLFPDSYHPFLSLGKKGLNTTFIATCSSCRCMIAFVWAKVKSWTTRDNGLCRYTRAKIRKEDYKRLSLLVRGILSGTGCRWYRELSCDGHFFASRTLILVTDVHVSHFERKMDSSLFSIIVLC